ncbi:GNAT family N-acetyltransferase [Phenylobacterium aquaticum]|uniref:GNAT family N-acetyltransferase n=1 Tax=Phenylobacterium aquaticum TaxID=1763816 RepID=UPI0026EB9BC7|nr:GNAT family N-acetyltransferase [Phenylobacterium aquaticum]
MSAEHPLDRPVWSALTGRQAYLATRQGQALRFDPAIGLFAAIPDTSPASLADLGALVRAHGDVALVEPAAPPPVPGTRVVSEALCWQMAAEGEITVPAAPFEVLTLIPADAPDMLALATLTQPGPFFERTHELSPFIGVKVDGRLVAMAGERMQPQGHAELSGVCTHPDHRGRGYAAALMRRIAARVRARGETPILHVYASNTGAIALYQTLGFAFRRELVMSTLTGD